MRTFLDTRFRKFLLDGVNLGGRVFELVGWSMAGLKEHTAWFFIPFQADGFVDATAIRDHLGDFEFQSLNGITARYMARVSQGFTTTIPTVTLSHHQLREINDIERDGYVFTDGVGTISPKLAAEIWKVWKKMSGGGSEVPSVFQVSIIFFICSHPS